MNNIPKTSLVDQSIKIKKADTERKVKHLDALYKPDFLESYFNNHQSNNKHS